MGSYSQEDVDCAVDRLFKQEEIEAVHTLLAQYGTQNYEREVFRVRLATLKLSQGDIRNLRKYIETAKMDYRDVLFWAEYKIHGKDHQLINNPYQDLI